MIVSVTNTKRFYLEARKLLLFRGRQTGSIRGWQARSIYGLTNRVYLEGKQRGLFLNLTPPATGKYFTL